MKWSWIIPLLLLALASCADAPVQKERLEIRIMTLNIGDPPKGKMEPLELAEIVEKADQPDFICLQEGYPQKAWQERIRNTLGYMHSFSGMDTETDVKDSTRTQLLLSRHPLQQVEARSFPSKVMHGSGLMALAHINNETIGVVCTHLDTIPKRRTADGTVIYGLWETIGTIWTEMFQETSRTRNVRDLFAWLDERPQPNMLIAGDFNTIFLSKAIRLMKERFVDALLFDRDYFTGTYQRIHAPIQPRVDFIFHSMGITTLDAEVLENPYGDHRAVVAHIALEN
ncbi:MAG: hypothetical protein F6K39_02020 [Okeania sp. SIO3B3]|nr:hypothetical protein [Okeania sp. SIO3B3]